MRSHLERTRRNRHWQLTFALRSTPHAASTYLWDSLIPKTQEQAPIEVADMEVKAFVQVNFPAEISTVQRFPRKVAVNAARPQIRFVSQPSSHLREVYSLESEIPKFFADVDLDAARSGPVGVAWKILRP